MMMSERNKTDEMLLRAQSVMFYNSLLIEQCSKWLSAEEGNKNMEKRIRKRKKQ